MEVLGRPLTQAAFNRPPRLGCRLTGSHVHKAVFFKGAVRMCGGAFTGNILGTLLLFLLDKVYVKIFRGDPPDAVRANAPPGSFASAIHEKVLSGLPKTSDELQIRQDGAEEILEIRASRKKPDWTPPRLVRVQDT
jgi:hypothetical protein